MRRLLLWMILTPVPALAGEFSISIVKIDPVPPVVNAQFSIVAGIANSSTADLHIAVSVTTGSVSRIVVLVPANNSTVAVVDGVFTSAGAHTVVADAYAAVLSNGVWVFASGFPPARPLAIATAPATTELVAVGLPQAAYVGPNDQEGDNHVWSSGVIQRVIGDDQTLFAVSKTAGIWRFTARQPIWTKLSLPPKAFSIVLDPNTPGRLIVGEHSDDATERFSVSRESGSHLIQARVGPFFMIQERRRLRRPYRRSQFHRRRAPYFLRLLWGGALASSTNSRHCVEHYLSFYRLACHHRRRHRFLAYVGAHGQCRYAFGRRWIDMGDQPQHTV